jgi:hypothetical protein
MRGADVSLSGSFLAPTLLAPILADCSVDCQGRDWPRHKQECARMAEEADENRSEYEKVYGKKDVSNQSSSQGHSQSSNSGVEAGDSQAPRKVRAMCGLCGGRKPPFRVTECCGRVVCHDYDNYVLMR